ncbi:type II toxin-antitoxin system Phd/YefM family antitoxin [Promicromonospora sp. NPDC050880]|uniref:type II toxin-antitoxin system Phd/YefM family antitoxin n=1 Tax=Promicromonospora sp. NPDC050880 TaxID=3364406 RepID=UPI00378D163F
MSSRPISPPDPPAVGVRELNQHTRRVLDVVRGGETVMITDHGRPIARLVPILTSPFDRLVAEGEYDLPRTTRIHVPPATPEPHRPTAEVLDELREDRL